MGIAPPGASDTAQIYDVNRAIATAGMAELSALWVPVSVDDWSPGDFTKLRLQTKNKYETAAVVATAWDTISLPWRLTRGGASVSQMCQSLVRRPLAKLASLDIAMPLPEKPDAFGKGKDGQMVNLSIHSSRKPARRDAEAGSDDELASSFSGAFSEYVVMRGLASEPDVEAQVRLYMDPCRIRQAFLWKEPMRVPIPYPQYFLSEGASRSQALSTVDTTMKNGDEKLVHLEAKEQTPAVELDNLEVLPVLSRLHCGGAMQSHAHRLATNLETALDYHSIKSTFISTGFEDDEFEEIRECLLTVAEEYGE